MLGDPRKKQIDFLSDLNTISMQAPSIKKKLENTMKSASLKLTRNKITQELVDPRKKLSNRLGAALMMSFIENYAN